MLSLSFHLCITLAFHMFTLCPFYSLNFVIHICLTMKWCMGLWGGKWQVMAEHGLLRGTHSSMGTSLPPEIFYTSD